jgi:hypothetical protein
MNDLRPMRRRADTRTLDHVNLSDKHRILTKGAAPAEATRVRWLLAGEPSVQELKLDEFRHGAAGFPANWHRTGFLLQAFRLWRKGNGPCPTRHLADHRHFLSELEVSLENKSETDPNLR